MKILILGKIYIIDLFLSTQAFSEDALNPLSNQLTFTFEGRPLARLQNIKPVLHPKIKTTTDHSVREDNR